jgi:hypothetical protein
LRKVEGSPWVYNESTLEYSLSINGMIVAIIDQYGNLKVTGRLLKIT